MNAAHNEVAPYFTVLIPWVPGPFQTVFHPTASVGPFAVLSRGAFPSQHDAILWAQENLGGTPYAVKRVDMNGIDYDDNGDKTG